MAFNNVKTAVQDFDKFRTVKLFLDCSFHLTCDLLRTRLARLLHQIAV